jgi:hypothetical protein
MARDRRAELDYAHYHTRVYGYDVADALRAQRRRASREVGANAFRRAEARRRLSRSRGASSAGDLAGRVVAGLRRTHTSCEFRTSFLRAQDARTGNHAVNRARRDRPQRPLRAEARRPAAPVEAPKTLMRDAYFRLPHRPVPAGTARIDTLSLYCADAAAQRVCSVQLLLVRMILRAIRECRDAQIVFDRLVNHLGEGFRT